MDYRRMHTGRRWVATLIFLQSSGFPLDESSSVQSPKSSIVGAGDRNRTGTGLLSPRDFDLDPPSETIESYLAQSQQYRNVGESED